MEKECYDGLIINPLRPLTNHYFLGSSYQVVVFSMPKMNKTMQNKRKTSYSYAIIAFHLAIFLKFMQAKEATAIVLLV